MEHPFGVIVRRRSSLVVLAVVAALGLGSCSGGLVGPAPAATVGGTDITRAELDDRIAQYQELVEALGAAAEEQRQAGAASGQESVTAEQLEAQIAERLAPFQVDDYTVGSEGVASQLTQMIGEQILIEALDDAGIEITDEQRDEARASLASSIEADGASIDDLPEGTIDAFVEFDAGQAALEAAAPQELRDAVVEAGETYEAQLRQAYDDNPAAFERVCGFILATDDEAAAQAAVERIEGGEAFAEVAAEVSTLEAEAASTVQCYDRATIEQIFSAEGVAAGDLLGPVEDTERWVVIEVDSLETAPFEEVRESLAQQVPDTLTQAAEAAIAEHVAEQLRQAAEDVTVDPRYGTWDADALQVVPNTVESTTTTLPIDAEIPVETIPAGS
jgi:hypothetical protein